MSAAALELTEAELRASAGGDVEELEDDGELDADLSDAERLLRRRRRRRPPLRGRRL